MIYIRRAHNLGHRTGRPSEKSDSAPLAAPLRRPLQSRGHGPDARGGPRAEGDLGSGAEREPPGKPRPGEPLICEERQPHQGHCSLPVTSTSGTAGTSRPRDAVTAFRQGQVGKPSICALYTEARSAAKHHRPSVCLSLVLSLRSACVPTAQTASAQPAAEGSCSRHLLHPRKNPELGVNTERPAQGAGPREQGGGEV